MANENKNTKELVCDSDDSTSELEEMTLQHALAGNASDAGLEDEGQALFPDHGPGDDDPGQRLGALQGLEVVDVQVQVLELDQAPEGQVLHAHHQALGARVPVQVLGEQPTGASPVLPEVVEQEPAQAAPRQASALKSVIRKPTPWPKAG